MFEIFFLVALAWGGFKALDRGVQVAGQRAKAAASKYAKAHPSKPGRAGAKTGRTVAAGAFGAFELARGFGSGFKAGWPEGRKQAYDWRDRRRGRGPADGGRSLVDESGDWPDGVSAPVSPPSLADSAPAPLDAVGADRAGLDETPPPPVESEDDRLDRRRAEAMRRLRPPENLPDRETLLADEPGAQPADQEPEYVPNEDDDTPAPSEGPTNQGDNMPDNDDAQRPVSSDGRQGHPNNNRGRQDGGDSSGEITNYPQLLDALQKIEDAATDDLEDAKADADRAAADLRQVEGMVASMTQLKLDQGSVGQVGQLSESMRARAEAASARQSAAEQRATQAQTARQTIEANYRQWYEASTSAPAVPEREFASA